MMNSERLTQCASGLSQRHTAAESDTERVRMLYELSVSRPPTDAEIAQHLSAVSDFTTLLTTDGMSETDAAETAWVATCHTMLMSTEFIYLP